MPETSNPPANPYSASDEEISALYVTRCRQAIQEGKTLIVVFSRAAQAFAPLRDAGRIAEAAALYESLADEIRAAGYSLDAYLAGENPLVSLESSDPASLYDLATLYHETGDYALAEALLKRLLVWQQTHQDEKRYDIAATMTFLAKIYMRQQRYDQAEPLFLRALTLRRKILAETHPDIAQSLNNLSELYYNQGRYEEAEPFLLQAIEIFRQDLGESHPHFLRCQKHLAGLYCYLLRYEEAEPILRQVEEWERQVLPEGHRDTAKTHWWLGIVEQGKRNYAAAEQRFQQAALILTKMLGANNPNTQTCYLYNIRLLREMGREEEASLLETLPEVWLRQAEAQEKQT